MFPVVVIYVRLFSLFRIECSYLNGSGRHVVLERVVHVFSITVYEDFLYWTDWSEKAVLRANKFNGGNIRRLVQDSSDLPTGIQVFAKERQNCKLSK